MYHVWLWVISLSIFLVCYPSPFLTNTVYIEGNFRGANICGFYLNVWPRIFYPQMKPPCLPLPAVQAPTTKILPTNILSLENYPLYTVLQNNIILCMYCSSHYNYMIIDIIVKLSVLVFPNNNWLCILYIYSCACMTNICMHCSSHYIYDWYHSET